MFLGSSSVSCFIFPVLFFSESCGDLGFFPPCDYPNPLHLGFTYPTHVLYLFRQITAYFGAYVSVYSCSLCLWYCLFVFFNFGLFLDFGFLPDVIWLWSLAAFCLMSLPLMLINTLERFHSSLLCGLHLGSKPCFSTNRDILCFCLISWIFACGLGSVCLSFLTPACSQACKIAFFVSLISKLNLFCLCCLHLGPIPFLVYSADWHTLTSLLLWILWSI